MDSYKQNLYYFIPIAFLFVGLLNHFYLVRCLKHSSTFWHNDAENSLMISISNVFS